MIKVIIMTTATSTAVTTVETVMITSFVLVGMVRMVVPVTVELMTVVPVEQIR